MNVHYTRAIVMITIECFTIDSLVKGGLLSIT